MRNSFPPLFCLVALLLSLPACQGRTAERKAARGTNYVADPDQIYFKNVRARHYRAEEVPNRATIYRHEDLYDSPARFRLALIDNWLDDRATLRYEVDSQHPAWELQYARDSAWTTVELATPPRDSNLHRLSRVLLSTAPLRLASPLDTVDAFPGGRGRTETRLVIADYLRLVGRE